MQVTLISHQHICSSAVLGPCEVLDEGAYGARQRSGSAWNDQSVFLCRRRFTPSSGCAMHFSAQQHITLVRAYASYSMPHAGWHGCPCISAASALVPRHLYYAQSIVVMLVVASPSL